MGGELVKLIVECEVGENSEAILSRICQVKYCLPDLGMYVVEVKESDFSQIKGLEGVQAVHSSAQITAQNSKVLDNDSNISSSEFWAEHLKSHPDYSGLTGKGITIAFLDTGVSPVPDLTLNKLECQENRILAFKDFINGRLEPYDDNAHGTHVWF